MFRSDKSSEDATHVDRNSPPINYVHYGIEEANQAQIIDDKRNK